LTSSPLGLTILEAEIVILALKIADTQRIFNLDHLLSGMSGRSAILSITSELDEIIPRGYDTISRLLHWFLPKDVSYTPSKTALEDTFRAARNWRDLRLISDVELERFPQRFPQISGAPIQNDYHSK
jgi:hypothetical protein